MMRFKENIPMALYTVFKIGGPAKYFCEVKNKDEMAEAFGFANSRGLPVFILGEGSNILVSDKGFHGLVIRNNIMGLRVDQTGEFVRISAGSGENWDWFVGFAVSRQLAGAECLSGIPGTVGATPVQNIGAYGQSVAEIIESVNALDAVSCRETVFSNEDCKFNYRTSRFKKDSGKYAITSVNFLLKQNGTPALKYHELKNYFSSNVTPSLVEARNAVLKIRSQKGMVNAGEELHSSVGSFFMNPVVPQDELLDLQKKIADCKKNINCCTDPWFWQKSNGETKISAACLIESAGFKKGTRRGNTGISPLHSLALINYGGARAAEVLELAKEIQNKVMEKFGINLEIEPQLVGF